MPDKDQQAENDVLISADTSSAVSPEKPVSGRVSISASQAISYHSPLPPPQVLAGYNTIVAPDAGDRILRMVERQEEHRQYLEKSVIDGDNRRADRGLICGTSVVLATILLAAYLAYLKQPSLGIAAIITELAVLGGVFIYGSKQREKERKERLDTQNKRRLLPAKDEEKKSGADEK